MKWLFLVHQVQTPNSRERVKVWRTIKKTGAVLHRNSVYVLPYSKDRLEDFQWVCQQIRDSKGEASIFVSEAQDPQEDRLLRDLFQTSREEEYQSFLQTAEALLERVREARADKRLHEGTLRNFEKEARQLADTLREIRQTDFFSAASAKKAENVAVRVQKELAGASADHESPVRRRHRRSDFQNKVWTTRRGIHVDRIGSAWLIRKFIDPKARFLFAPEDRLPKNAIPFDVLGAEFSHHGENCTFETLLKAFGIRNPALQSIAEVVHDIDLKDHKYGRAEAEGLNVVLRALSQQFRNDDRMLAAGSEIFDALFAYFQDAGKRRK